MRFDSDFAMLIGGAMERGSANFAVVNPATEEEFAHAPDASEADLDRAVAAARAAFPVWSTTPIDERRVALRAMAKALVDHQDALMRLLTQEQGKPHADALGEVLGAAHWLEGAASLDIPVTVNEDSEVRYSETRRVPIGVVGAIAPWNYPLLLAMFKVGPALLTGNTLVLKPSPFTPLTTLKFGELVKDILPAGVLNIVTGGDALGPWLTSHSGIDKISFTGSTATGKRVMHSAAASLKRITLELGGNDPAIILPDADPEAIAEQIFWAGFGNAGQICIASKRIYIHIDIYDRLRDALIAYARTVQVGNGAEQGTQIGPINNRLQYQRVCDLINDAKANGYAMPIGGEAPPRPGYFVPITILDNPPEDSRIVQEEQFGPIMPLLKYESIDEAIHRANACDYGLAASVWGDAETALQVAPRLKSGTIWINETRHLSPLVAFGGMKQSGIGVEGGEEGLCEYTYTQTIALRRG
jgi:acyl-CoA reductase-like NAD-dependent aldehyde dehydrogenase